MKENMEEMIEQYLSIFLRDNHIANSFSMSQYLSFMNISHIRISKIPTGFGTLPHLKNLDLSYNFLGKNNDKNRWLWLSQTAIQNNLLSLDLSNNSLTELPIQVMRLNVLKTLNISHNKLKYLPQSIRNLHRLSILEVSDNSLVYLPQSICNLPLNHTDITMNPFSQALDIRSTSLDIVRYPFLHNSIGYAININNEVPSLIKLSFRKIIQQRITYDTSEIPRTLIEYLDKVAKYCANCGKPCFDSYVWDLTDCFPPCPMARGVRMSDNIELQFERYCCSRNCLYRHVIQEY